MKNRNIYIILYIIYSMKGWEATITGAVTGFITCYQLIKERIILNNQYLNTKTKENKPLSKPRKVYLWQKRNEEKRKCARNVN